MEAPGSSIPLAVPAIRGNEWKYVKECLDTGWVSSVGPYVERLEGLVAERAGTKHAVATVSGTAALHTALVVAGVEPDDEVLVPTLTFVAPANAVRYAGAWPVLIDAEPTYWQIDPARVAHFLDNECRWAQGRLENRRTGRRVRAMIVVHILGHPVDMAPLLELARRYELVVIEDAAEALGAAYQGRPVGSLGDIGCFSFNGNKTITTGGGGMLVTDRGDWASRAKYLTTQAKDDPVEYVHDEVGYNYRLSNLLAAVGCAQMEQLDVYLEEKRRNAREYTRALDSVPGIEPMRAAPWADSAFWLYTVLVDPREFGEDSRALMGRLAAEGIQSRPLWQPLHLNRPFRELARGSFPVAEELARRALSLPCSVGLTDADRQRVIAAMQRTSPVYAAK